MSIRVDGTADESRLLQVIPWLIELRMVATDVSGAACLD